MLRDLILPYALADARLGDDVLEVGPGPGMTTDLLRADVAKLTAVELDEGLAAALEERLPDTNVEVVNADATAMPFDDGRFSGAVSFTMLHHVPIAELQDRLVAEVARVLRPGASSWPPTASPATSSRSCTTATPTTRSTRPVWRPGS